MIGENDGWLYREIETYIDSEGTYMSSEKYKDKETSIHREADRERARTRRAGEKEIE